MSKVIMVNGLAFHGFTSQASASSIATNLAKGETGAVAESVGFRDLFKVGYRAEHASKPNKDEATEVVTIGRRKLQRLDVWCDMATVTFLRYILSDHGQSKDAEITIEDAKLFFDEMEAGRGNRSERWTQISKWLAPRIAYVRNALSALELSDGKSASTRAVKSAKSPEDKVKNWMWSIIKTYQGATEPSNELKYANSCALQWCNETNNILPVKDSDK